MAPLASGITSDNRDRFIRVCTVAEGQQVDSFDKDEVVMLEESTSAGAQNENDYGAGNKWLVKSGRVIIQAQYSLDNPDSPERRFVVKKLAVGGDFLAGDILIIGSVDDSITWNGKPILVEQPSSFEAQNGKVTATRDPNALLVQDLTKENPGVIFNLPLGVSLVVKRVHGHVNAAIKMTPQEGGQDGLCGNFNGFAPDDALDLASERFNPEV